MFIFGRIYPHTDQMGVKVKWFLQKCAIMLTYFVIVTNIWSAYSTLANVSHPVTWYFPSAGVFRLYIYKTSP